MLINIEGWTLREVMAGAPAWMTISEAKQQQEKPPMTTPTPVHVMEHEVKEEMARDRERQASEQRQARELIRISLEQIDVAERHVKESKAHHQKLLDAIKHGYDLSNYYAASRYEGGDG